MAEYVVDRENVWPYGFQREEIVRCRDCKHYTDHSINLRPHWCRKHGSYHISPDGFCAWGERRDA
jgi:hypothetical protein